MHRRGYTLLELMLTVAIIVVLVALLLPALNKAREKNSQATCLQNHRRLLTHVDMLREDNKDIYPAIEAVWLTGNEEYTGLKCPSAGKNAKVSYAYNGQLAGMPRTHIFDPAHTIVAIDGKKLVTSSEFEDRVTYRHNGKAIAGYVDGHIALVDPSRMDLFFYGDLYETQRELEMKFGKEIVTAESWEKRHPGKRWEPPVSYPKLRLAKMSNYPECLPTLITEMNLYPTHAFHRHQDGPPTTFFSHIIFYDPLRGSAPKLGEVIDSEVYLDPRHPEKIHDIFMYVCWRATSRKEYEQGIVNIDGLEMEAAEDAKARETLNTMKESLRHYCPDMDERFWDNVKRLRGTETGAVLTILNPDDSKIVTPTPSPITEEE